MEINQFNQAVKYIKSGKKKAGGMLLVELLHLHPRDGYAWMWLSLCVRPLNQKLTCLREAVRVDPEHSTWARQALDWLAVPGNQLLTDLPVGLRKIRPVFSMEHRMSSVELLLISLLIILALGLGVSFTSKGPLLTPTPPNVALLAPVETPVQVAPPPVVSECDCRKAKAYLERTLDRLLEMEQNLNAANAAAAVGVPDPDVFRYLNWMAEMRYNQQVSEAPSLCLQNLQRETAGHFSGWQGEGKTIASYANPSLKEALSSWMDHTVLLREKVREARDMYTRCIPSGSVAWAH